MRALAQRGTCTVLYDHVSLTCCIMPVVAAAGAKIATLEGLGTVEKSHSLRRAFIDEHAARGGYCIHGLKKALGD